MDVRDIKMKAKEFSDESRMLLFKVIVILTLIILVKDELVSSSVVVSFIFSFLFLTFQHGVVSCVLKIINNREKEFEFPRETFTGLIRIKELFSTYFVYTFIQYAVIMVVLMIAIFGVLGSGDALYLWEIYLSSGTLSPSAIELIGSSIVVILIACGFLLAFSIYYLVNFSLTYFILEKEGITGIAAMKKSMKLMKGNRWLYVKLLLSFFFKAFAILLVFMTLSAMIPVLSSIISGISGLVMAWFVTVDLSLCKAIFYEEVSIDYQEKNYEGNV